jgi:acetyltransferase
MSIYNLDKIFKPTSVAVIGASEKKGSIGYALINNLKGGGYPKSIFPINPHYPTIIDLKAYPSLLDIGQSVDLAVIATPIATVPAIMEQCAQTGVGGVIIISAGGKEIGKKGQETEVAIKKVADKHGIRIVGPNCLGIICPGSKLNASFASHMALSGTLAFVSQSGAICTAVLDLSIKEHIGFSHFVSVGSMLDVDFGDLIDYLGNDPQVGSIVLYIESLSGIDALQMTSRPSLRKFMSAARAVARIKPIVVLKAGRSGAGARAAASHTGALAGEDAVYDAAFKRAGIVRINTIEELFDCAELMARQPHPSGSGLAIITNAGGPGVMAVDALASHGIEPVSLSPETLKKLDEILPPFWSRGNPIDILGDATAERYRQVVEVCLSAPEINALLIMLAPQAMTDPTSVAATLTETLQGKSTSVFTVWMGGIDVEKGRILFNKMGIPTYETPERAIRAFMHMYSYGHNLELLQQTPPKLLHTLEFDQARAGEIIREALPHSHTLTLLTEIESKALLAAYGIPVNQTEVATTVDEAIRLAKEIGYPLAMKIHSRDIVHKSDAHGVQLNLRHEQDIKEAFTKIMANAREYNPKAKLLGVTLQPMVKRPDYELILGSKKDADFGPVILFGMGGVMTEVLKDRAIALPPLNRLLARQLVESTKVYQLLKGYRNRPPANVVLLEEILIRLSQLITDFPEIAELDINPMILLEDKAYAVDARVLLKPSTVPSPRHLVISPYPNQYEMTTVTEGGLSIFIRPIKPEDEPLMVDLFYTLSPQSIYFRFFRFLKSLPHEMLARFTQIDYDRELALVAVKKSNEESEGEKILGVGRLISDPDLTTAEFAVLVGDPWQGKGIGTKLLERCIAIAKERSIRTLWGTVLAENTTMLALCHKLGFTITKGSDATEYRLEMNLKNPSL